MSSIIAGIIQFVKFGIVGILNTLIALVIYYALVFIGFHYILSNTMAFGVSVINAYYWNQKYVFSKSKENQSRKLLKIYASYGFTFLLSTGLLFLMVSTLGISHYIAPIINLFITTPLNFILNKYWVFKA